MHADFNKSLETQKKFQAFTFLIIILFINQWAYFFH